MKRITLLAIAALILGAPGWAIGKKHGPSMQLPAQAVQHYVVDAFGDVDGLLLAGGWFVKIPKHQSDQVTSMVQPGDVVVVSGTMAGSQVIEVWSLTNTTNNAVLGRTPKPKKGHAPPKLPKHLRAAALQPMEAQGRVSHLMHGKKGEIKVALLEDGTALRFGKHASWMIGARLGVGSDVFARGLGTQNTLGRALEVTEIAVNGGPVTSLYAVPQ